MKLNHLFFLGLILLSCNSNDKKIEIDQSKHIGLTKLNSNHPFKTLFSNGEINQAKKQTDLINEAYQFLSEIMGPKNEFCLLVIASKDWVNNAYSPNIGMPEYYRGNLIVGAEQNEMASNFEEMIRGFPKEITNDLIAAYNNDLGEFDLSLFFDKLSIHELTHNFQDPNNKEGYSMSRWLEEIHANMGLYAFYKTKRPNELKYVMNFVEFNLNNPPPNLEYESLTDFDSNYYTMSPPNYGQYQMKFTKAAQKLIDSLGNDILKPINEFIIKYDESWIEKVKGKDFKNKIATEIHPFLLEIMENW